jgi:hypothetical protein
MSTEEAARRPRLGVGTKVGLTAGVALLAIGALSYGVFASFTDTQSAGSQAIQTGEVHIVLGTPGGDHGSISTGPINKLAEGDNVYRVAELTNDTNISKTTTTGLATLKIQAAIGGANAGSNVVTDTVNGLHVTAKSCPVAPVETGGTTGPWTYTCTGKAFTSATKWTTVVNNVALRTLSTTATTLPAPKETASIYYVVDLTLPSTYTDPYSHNAGACSTVATTSATKQFMNCSLSVTYNFTATQRAGANQ